MFDTIIKQMSAYMNRQHMKQKDFAKAIGVSASAVSSWFSGQRTPNTKNYITFLLLLEEEEINGNF